MQIIVRGRGGSKHLSFGELFVFGEYFLATASRPQRDTRPVTVLLQDVVFWGDELKIPSRVGGILFFIPAASAGRMREANAFDAFEHENIDEVFKIAVVKRFLEFHG